MRRIFWGAVFVMASLLVLAACSFKESEKSTAISIEDDFRCRSTFLGQCNWYNTCLEDSMACGDTGYAVGYGFRYCSKFAKLEGTDNLMRWRDETMICLQKELLKAYDAGINACTDLRKSAFDSHPKCYTEGASICLQNISDIRKVLMVVDMREFANFETYKQMMATAKICIGQVKDAMGFNLIQDIELEEKLALWADAEIKYEERANGGISLK